MPPKKKTAKFNPEGSGYDMDFAKASGMKPSKQSDGKLHWSSREPNSGRLLKGRQHPTWDKLVDGEKRAGYKIYKAKDGYYYSKKK